MSTPGLARTSTLPAKIGRRLIGGLKYHAGPTLVNRLGYQVARTLYMNVAWRLRNETVAPELRGYVEALERDGYVKIPNFLSADAFAEVRREYDASFDNVKYDVPIVEDNLVVEESLDIHRAPEQFPSVRANLVHSERLRAIVEGALRRPAPLRPRAWSKRWYPAPTQREVIGPGHVVGANYVHADVHFPSFKAWLFLSDADPSNGVLEFAPGSHRVTLARLAYEYDASVRVATARRRSDRNTVPYALIRMPREEQLAQMGIECVPMTCKANTLVVGNMQGFHRQGNFQPGTKREALLLCYRNAEPACALTPGDVSWQDSLAGINGTGGGSSYSM